MRGRVCYHHLGNVTCVELIVKISIKINLHQTKTLLTDVSGYQLVRKMPDARVTMAKVAALMLPPCVCIIMIMHRLS